MLKVANPNADNEHEECLLIMAFLVPELGNSDFMSHGVKVAPFSLLFSLYRI